MTTTETTAAETKDPETAESAAMSFMQEVIGLFSPTKKTGEQKKTSDEVEDERKKAATKDTATLDKALHSPNDEPSESTVAESVKQKRLNSPCHTDKQCWKQCNEDLLTDATKLRWSEPVAAWNFSNKETPIQPKSNKEIVH